MNIKKLNWQILRFPAEHHCVSQLLFFLSGFPSAHFPWPFASFRNRSSAFADWSSACVLHLSDRIPTIEVSLPPSSQPQRRHSRILCFSTFIMSRWLPASQGAPQIGQKLRTSVSTIRMARPSRFRSCSRPQSTGKLGRECSRRMSRKRERPQKACR